MRKFVLFTFALILLSVAPVHADCHFSNAVPVVSSWTISAAPGAIVIDAKLQGGAPYFGAQVEDREGSWGMVLGLDGTEFHDLAGATVTDSTFHVEIAHAAGTFSFDACVSGAWYGEAQVCSGCNYEQSGALEIPPATTATARASWGAVRARWAK